MSRYLALIATLALVACDDSAPGAQPATAPASADVVIESKSLSNARTEGFPSYEGYPLVQWCGDHGGKARCYPVDWEVSGDTLAVIGTNNAWDGGKVWVYWVL